MTVAVAAPRIAGIDEAGRGPLAGPVVVVAVVFDPARPRINGLADSKQLCAARGEMFEPMVYKWFSQNSEIHERLLLTQRADFCALCGTNQERL